MIHVAGLPATKGSHRGIVKNGRAVVIHDNRNLKAWTEAVAWTAKAARMRRIAKPLPVSVALWFFIERPKTVKRADPTVAPDIDKLVRACLDALTGIAYEDDCQVVKLEAYKRYVSDQPRRDGASVGTPGVAIEVEVYDSAEEMPF